ncbi:hypothetical protein ANN_19738 [Periplaneta americana]|uniref:Uncharacterized protein n=1 Tax=Periplaneta americana TaxID=6978 RepID=A0ABQ8SAQ7_PERAM|nr:hypothetical protein ANN_19738 [Periplaneta americana]
MSISYKAYQRISQSFNIEIRIMELESVVSFKDFESSNLKNTHVLLTEVSSRQHLLNCGKGKRCRPVCTVVQQEEIESIPASSYECTLVHCLFRRLSTGFKLAGHWIFVAEYWRICYY